MPLRSLREVPCPHGCGARVLRDTTNGWLTEAGQATDDIPHQCTVKVVTPAAGETTTFVAGNPAPPNPFHRRFTESEGVGADFDNASAYDWNSIFKNVEGDDLSVRAQHPSAADRANSLLSDNPEIIVGDHPKSLHLQSHARRSCAFEWDAEHSCDLSHGHQGPHTCCCGSHPATKCEYCGRIVQQTSDHSRSCHRRYVSRETLTHP